MASGYPTRLYYGVGTQPATAPFGSYPLPDPINSSATPTKLRTHTYNNDFDTLIGTDYAVTGTGTPTFALGTGAGGVVVATTTTGATDSVNALKHGNAFAFAAGQRGWYRCSFQISDVAHTTAVVGLVDASPIVNGLYFSMAAGGVVSLVGMSSSVATTLVANVTTLSSATQVELALYYDGADLNVFVNGGKVARVAGLTMTSAAITPVFQLVNTAAAAHTMTIDYITVAEELVSVSTGEF